MIVMVVMSDGDDSVYNDSDGDSDGDGVVTV